MTNIERAPSSPGDVHHSGFAECPSSSGALSSRVSGSRGRDCTAVPARSNVLEPVECPVLDRWAELGVLLSAKAAHEVLPPCRKGSGNGVRKRPSGLAPPRSSAASAHSSRPRTTSARLVSRGTDGTHDARGRCGDGGAASRTEHAIPLRDAGALTRLSTNRRDDP